MLVHLLDGRTCSKVNHDTKHPPDASRILSRGFCRLCNHQQPASQSSSSQYATYRGQVSYHWLSSSERFLSSSLLALGGISAAVSILRQSLFGTEGATRTAHVHRDLRTLGLEVLRGCFPGRVLVVMMLVIAGSGLGGGGRILCNLLSNAHGRFLL